MNCPKKRIALELTTFCAFLLAGCASLERQFQTSSPSGSAGGSPAAPVTVQAEPFSADRAFAHLRALAELGPRPAGSPASLEAGEYIRTRLEGLGLEVEEIELELEIPPAEKDGEPGSLVLRHLVARLPSDSPDEILLFSHYDSAAESAGANDGASGAALLLELAAQLVERPLPYHTEFWFLDGDAGAPPAAPVLKPLAGSRALAASIQDTSAVRLAVVFRQVGDADLKIARDLISERTAREEFFSAARDLGHGEAFPTDRGFLQTEATHRALFDRGFPRVVAIIDPAHGGEEPPGTFAGEQDTVEHTSKESLRAVGETSLLALRRHAARLQKVDWLSGRAERRSAEALAPSDVESEAVEDDLELAEPGAALPEPGAELPEPGAELGTEPTPAPGAADALPLPEAPSGASEAMEAPSQKEETPAESS